MSRRFRPIEPEPVGPQGVIDVGPGEPCPSCGADLGEHRRAETRRMPNPEGGRGSTTARVTICGSCGEVLGPA